MSDDNLNRSELPTTCIFVNFLLMWVVAEERLQLKHKITVN